MRRFFITSTGTGIGKTFTTCALLHQLRAQKCAVAAFKPVVSGYTADDVSSDTALILRASGLPDTMENAMRISPWRFAAPLSPHMAAAREGKILVPAEIVAFSEAAGAEADITLIEGVGGVMVPLTWDYTVLDWMDALRYPVLLVTGSYLGALSHTLTALLALRSRNIPVAGVVVSESENSDVPLEDTLKTLQGVTANSLPLAALPRIAAREDAYMRVPDITWLVRMQ